MSAPTVTVVIPAYNAASFIGETLASAARQGSKSFSMELVVVDDGSTDRTADIVCNDFPDALLIRQPNQGCSAARSAGMHAANGKYIKFLDADDILLPGMLARQLVIAEETNADAVYGNWQKLAFMDDEWKRGEAICREIHDVSSDAELAFFTSMWCPTGAYLWRSEFLSKKHPGWRAHLPVIQDARFAQDAAAAGATFVHDDRIGILYRVHQTGSVSTANRVAFLRDCFVNATDAVESWESAGDLSVDRRRGACAVFAMVGRAAAHRDRELRNKAIDWLTRIGLDSFKCGGPRFEMVKALIGWRGALRLASGLDWLKGLSRKAS